MADPPAKHTLLWEVILLSLSLHVLAPTLHPLHLTLQEA